MIRLEDEKEPRSVSNKTKKEGAGVIKLVDVEDNQFVLSKGKDTTVPHEDRHFIQVRGRSRVHTSTRMQDFIQFL